jgi:F-box interacting protein
MVAAHNYGERGDDGDNYYMIDKKGTTSTYLPPWITKDNYSIDDQLSNSCNGMILVPMEKSFFLFNPATKYFTKVLELDFYLDHRDYYKRLGLSYDASINDYRVVLLASHSSPISGGRYVAQATLKGKEWTHVDFPFGLRSVEQGPFFNGRVHWITYTNLLNKLEQHIVSYDPVSNAFEKLPPPLPQRYWVEKDIMGLPPRKLGAEGIIMGLGVIDGCLWMTRQIDGVNGVEVLKMEEYGMAESWKTMFVLRDIKDYPYVGRYLIPLLKTDNNGVLFHKSWLDEYSKRYGCGSEIFEYDPETNSCQTRFKTSKYETQAVPFVNNLSDPPVGYDWDPVQHQQFGNYSGNSVYDERRSYHYH